MRVLISTVSLAALLLAQFLPALHAHLHVVDLSEVSVRPHFHLHGHDDDHDHHLTSHDVIDEHHDLVPDRNGASFQREHDDDAVFVDVLPGLPATGADCSIKSASGGFGIVVDCGAVTSIELPPPEAVAEPPPAILNALPIFLRTHSLRI